MRRRAKVVFGAAATFAALATGLAILAQEAAPRNVERSESCLHASVQGRGEWRRPAVPRLRVEDSPTVRRGRRRWPPADRGRAKPRSCCRHQESLWAVVLPSQAGRRSAWHRVSSRSVPRGEKGWQVGDARSHGELQGEASATHFGGASGPHFRQQIFVVHTEEKAVNPVLILPETPSSARRRCMADARGLADARGRGPHARSPS